MYMNVLLFVVVVSVQQMFENRGLGIIYLSWLIWRWSLHIYWNLDRYMVLYTRLSLYMVLSTRLGLCMVFCMRLSLYMTLCTMLSLYMIL